MTDPQKLQLERVKVASFNNFDGELVAKDLEENQHLYKAFVFGRFGYGALIELRDLADGYLNGDTLMVLTRVEHIKAIKKLADKWEANEFGYCVREGKRIGNIQTDGHIKPYGTAPFHNDRDLHVAFGYTLEEGEALVRIWWD